MRSNSIKTVLFGFCIIILAWSAISFVSAVPIIPQPFDVAKTLFFVFSDTIIVHLVYSVFRILVGVLIASILGYLLGVFMGYIPLIGRLFSPIVYLSYPIPKIALLPIIMLFLGIGEMSKLTIVFLIVFFQVVVVVRDAVIALPEEYFFPLYSLGSSFHDVLRHVVFPATLPKLFSAIRVAMATAISVLFFTETFGTDYGIGYYIMDAWLRVNYLEMYAGIVVLSLVGLLLFLVIDGMEYYFCRWQYK